MANKKNTSTDLLNDIFFMSVPILFIISIPTHFLYDFTGKLDVLGAFVPVNESIAEHFKLTTFPLIIWFILVYFIYKTKLNLNFKKWVISTAIYSLVIPIFITTFYYTNMGAFNLHTLTLDILSLLFGLILGQWLSYHYYKYGSCFTFLFIISVIFLISLIIFTIYFTFNPPHIPLFQDGPTGIYGIL